MNPDIPYMRVIIFALLILPGFLLAEEPNTNPGNSELLRDSITATGLSFANAADFSWRCPQIINCGQGIRDKLGCTNKVIQLTKAVQMHNSRNYLEDELKKLANDRDAHRVLRNIVNLAKQARKFNLWEVTLRGFRGDKEKAMRFLATYFQADGFTSEHFSPEINAMKDEAYKLITPGIREGAIEAYPKGLGMQKTTIYHFYANAVIASNLRRQGVPNRYASALTIAFNEFYEYGSLAGRTAGALYHGHNMPQLQNQDIYSGYAGVQFALSKDIKTFSGPSYHEWKKQFSQRGMTATSDYLKAGLGGKEAFCNDHTSFNDPVGSEQIKQALEPVTIPEASNY